MTQEELTKIKAIARDIAKQEVAKVLDVMLKTVERLEAKYFDAEPVIEKQEENYDAL